MLEPSGHFKAPTFVELFCGVGGFAIGFGEEGFECRGAIDFDELCCEDHLALTGHEAWCVDIQRLTPEEILRRFGLEAPDVVALSPPCQGFSGCLPPVMAERDKYKALNSLSYYAIWLVLKAWEHRRPPLIVVENVPRAMGSSWMQDTRELLEECGYRVSLHAHNCGAIGPLAQNRHRMLLMARHIAQIPDGAPVLLPPAMAPLPLRAVLDPLPIPRVKRAGEQRTMHHLAALSPANLLRLAAVEPGKDHHAIPPLVLHNHSQINTGLGCSPRNGTMGVLSQDAPAGTVIGSADIHAGAYACEDPRLTHSSRRGNGTVLRGELPAPCVIGDCRSYKGFNVIDGRIEASPGRHPAGWGVLDPDRPSFTIRGAQHVQTTFRSFCDRRMVGTQTNARHNRYDGGYGVNGADGPAHTVIANSEYHGAWASVEDRRMDACAPRPSHRESRYNGGYGVNAASAPAHTIVAGAKPHCAWASVEDRRGWPVATHYLKLPDTRGRGIPVPVLHGPPVDWSSKRHIPIVICSPWGGHHRPLTPAELGVIQGFKMFTSDGEPVRWAGNSVERWCKAIGNAVPPPAAAAIARSCRRAIKAAAAGGFSLFSPSEVVWVERPFHASCEATL